MNKIRKLIFSGILLTIVFQSCDKSSLYPPAPKNPDKQLLLELVNEQRSKGCNCGDTYYGPVDAVTWNDRLEEAAQNHSNDMDKNDNLDHTGSDGSLPGDRINSTGYTWITYGENIAAGYSTESEVIKGWLDSPGHCKNIMNGDVTEMGVATSEAYWTQVFAAPR